MYSGKEHDKIMDIFTDNLSDIPSESDKSFDRGSDMVILSTRRKNSNFK